MSEHKNGCLDVRASHSAKKNLPIKREAPITKGTTAPKPVPAPKG